MDNVSDLITHAYDQKPIEFQSTFSNLIADRLVKAIDDRKIEVAQSMFRPEESEVESDEEFTDTEETEDGAAA
jgi:hypothetical protein